MRTSVHAVNYIRTCNSLLESMYATQNEVEFLHGRAEDKFAFLLFLHTVLR